MKHCIPHHLIIRCLAVLLITAIFGGCAMVGPDYQRPEAPVADDWRSRETDLFEPEPEAQLTWWELFDDPVLNELIQTAYEQNLTLRQAGLRVLEARAQLGIATGSLYPQVQDFSGDYFWVDPAQPPGASSFNSASVGFDAAWELDFWGKFRRGVESADANLLASIAGYDDFLLTLTADVARTYILIRTLDERIDIAEKNVELQTRTLKIVQTQFDVGVVTELDVQQAKTLLHSTESTIPQLALSRDQARHALAVLLGIPPEEIDTILAKPGNLPKIPETVAVGMPADLLRRRPDIRQAELQAVSQSARIGIARSEMLPSFTLFGTLGWSASDAGTGNFGDPAFNASFGPAFTWPVFNYGRLRNRVRVEDARFEAALTSYQNAVLNAAREVEDAMSAFVRTGVREEILEKAVNAAERSTSLAMIQYREGRVDYQRVLDATRSLAVQQDSYIQTVGDNATSVIALYKALGGGWEIRLGKPFVPESLQEQMQERTNWGNMLEVNTDAPPEKPEGDKYWRRPDW
jgi:NodT family efflux transporter outer membrane factor (OMF) lipoprotein